MGDVVSFPRRWPRHRSVAPGFAVFVARHDNEWLAVCRQHSWSFATRSEAQRFARDVADGFGVPVAVQLWGAA
jgi:hypothetical protein